MNHRISHEQACGGGGGDIRKLSSCGFSYLDQNNLGEGDHGRSQNSVLWLLSETPILMAVYSTHTVKCIFLASQLARSKV